MKNLELSDMPAKEGMRYYAQGSIFNMSAQRR